MAHFAFTDPLCLRRLILPSLTHCACTTHCAFPLEQSVVISEGRSACLPVSVTIILFFLSAFLHRRSSDNHSKPPVAISKGHSFFSPCLFASATNIDKYIFQRRCLVNNIFCKKVSARSLFYYLCTFVHLYLQLRIMRVDDMKDAWFLHVYKKLRAYGPPLSRNASYGFVFLFVRLAGL